MSGPTLRGLTWDHPRGYAPLEALGGAVSWDRQPLEGFESHPIDDLAARYDLLVVDHPGIGEAAAAGCLRPMEDLLEAEELRALRTGTVGRSFESYRYAGRQWALPIDAAAQVSAVRPDLVAERPATWSEVLASEAPMVLPLGGPHALLTLLAISVALGNEPGAGGGLVDAAAGRQALRIMGAVVGRADPSAPPMNPIQVLEAMATTDRIALCPLVFGYVTYSAPSSPRRRPVRFLDAPGAETGGRPGSVLGGTGVAVSLRAPVSPALVGYLRNLTGPAQRTVVPEAGGQPAARAAWTDEALDARSGGFFRGTRATVEDAWVRPRHPGYVPFQAAASAAVREGLLGGEPPGRVLARIEELYESLVEAEGRAG